MKFKFIETHCHLEMLKQRNISDAINSSIKEGIDKILTVASSPSSLEQVVSLTRKSELIYGSQGIHPHEAKFYNSDVKAEIVRNIKNNKKLVAIGEIGLDYHYNFSPKDIQIKVFREQLELAISLGQNIIIHSRESDEDMISILKEYASSFTGNVVIHSFSSGLPLAEAAIDLGFYLGFNGMITFKKADDVREALKITPINQMVFETDSPYLTPVPHRGKENSPHFVPLVAKEAAKILNQEEDSFFDQIYDNSIKLFFSKEQK